MIDLSIEFAGLKLKNPLIAASAGTTKDAVHCKKAADAGYSAVILKSVQEERINRYNPFPRMSIIRNGIPGYQSVTFMTYEQAFEGEIEDYCEEIKRTKDMLDIPVIASLNCANEQTWAQYAVKCEAAGADALEIVPSCPVGAFVREAAEFYPAASKALKSVKEVVKIPAGLKMTQQMSNPILCARNLEEDGADWVTMFNRSSGFQIDIDTMEPIMHKGFCGHGGPWVIQSVMRWIAASYPYVRIPISATGGAANYEDVVRYMLSGAATVQIASLIYMKGYDIVKRILEDLVEYLEKHKLDKVSTLTGIGANKVLPLSEADRSHRYYAEVDYENCIRCQNCFPVCIYGAITQEDRRPVIHKDICDGCGLCSQVCNRAITMKQR
ncbi:MAG: 4Fe-4S binding protein [Dorea sp.]|nr:4Fe-4S binding protein [Dorea sp.]